MAGSRDLSYVVIDLLENTARNIKAHPVNLGGIAGAGGGVGGPPGGFIGWLPQTRVAYDTDEFATPLTSGSGTLLDNLNHIRYRLELLEVSSGILVVTDGITTVNDVQELRFSGGAVVTELSAGHALVTITASGAALTVEEIDSSPSVTNVDKIIFSGATVTSLGSGDVLVSISGGGGGGDGTYLRLDAANDPVTGQLVVDVDTLAGSSQAAVTILLDEVVTFGYGLYVEAAGNIPAYFIAHDAYDVFYLDQLLDTPGTKTGAAHYISRYSTGASNIVQTQHALVISDDSTGVTFSGGTLKHTYDYTRSIVDINPYVASGGSMLLLDSVNLINNSGRLVSLKNQETEKFYVTGSGLVNIPAGQTYNINGSPHTHDTDGWTAGGGTWSYSSADDPTFVISINADVTGTMQVGDRVKLTQTTAKYFIITAVGSFSGGATLVTVYGGTDYDLANAAISSPYYSHVKNPFGFPTSPAKWTVELSDTSSRTQGSPVSGTWYNPGSLSISIPIGAWKVECIVSIYTTANAASQSVFFTLSTANNSESDVDFTGFTALTAPAGIYTFYAPIYRVKPLSLASKTSYYLNIKTVNAGVSTIGITGDLSKTFVRAICAYL